jgi:HD-GYP domain-containing protein (c-di-GMP phosphodiesterase class II)
MDAEPEPHLMLEGAQIDEALTALGAFADLADLVGHSTAVAGLAARAAKHLGCADDEVSLVQRAALIQDLGKVAVPFRIWHQDVAPSADDWEKIRLHPYYTERVLSHSPYLAELAHVAGRHHERLDGSGYHRGLSGSELDRPARLLAAAEAYRSTVELTAGRTATTDADAAGRLRADAGSGILDRDAVSAVLEAAGHRPERIVRPDGLTPREEQVLTLLASGRGTKQIGSALGVTVKTADHYVQQVYAKIGVSTRAAAAVYAVRHGFAVEATREFPR